jgi:hypothetical protein
MRGRRRRAGGFTRFLKVLAISIILGVVGWHPVEKREGIEVYQRLM